MYMKKRELLIYHEKVQGRGQKNGKNKLGCSFISYLRVLELAYFCKIQELKVLECTQLRVVSGFQF